MNNNELFDKIRQWGRDRGLDKTSAEAQHGKLLEEAAELWEAMMAQDKTEIIDAIGDCVVVLTMIAMQERLKIEDCIACAYDTIKNRKGKLVNGVFVKDEPSSQHNSV